MFNPLAVKDVPPAEVFASLATRRVIFIGEGEYGCLVTARGVGEVLDGVLQTSPAHRELCIEVPEAYADLLCELETRYGVTPHAVDSSPMDSDALDEAVFDMLDGHGCTAIESIFNNRLAAQPDIAANIKTATEDRPALVLFGAAYLGEEGIPARFPPQERGIVAVFKEMADFKMYVEGERLWGLPRMTPVLDYLYLAKERRWLKSDAISPS